MDKYEYLLKKYPEENKKCLVLTTNKFKTWYNQNFNSEST